ncbi:peptidylprolyl isomerase [Pyruvatibacter sp.]|uniref:peptidylprolyl isomerase n=1 Tax=Pyruvatibacter sp. TaxID=1981328 RepID=UPI0032654818
MSKTRWPAGLWREPLVHFLLAGAFIFALYAWVGDDDQESGRIVVSLEQVEQLALVWQRTWNRPPTDEELQGLVRNYIKDEVYYREALKLGLDVNDQVIRRRLRQKLEFFAAESAVQELPSQEVLKEWFDENAQRYEAPPTYTFVQVYFAALDTSRMEEAETQLADGVFPSDLGDAIALPQEMDAATSNAVTRAFGEKFTDALASLPINEWSGPVVSGLGHHLVWLSASTPSRPVAFAEVRRQVERDWLGEERVKAEEAAYAAMSAQYEIEIEGQAE